MPLPLVAAAGIGAGISAAGNIIGGLFQNSSNKSSNKLAFQQQQQLMRDEYLYNSQLYNEAFQREASYNSPLAQMSRLRMAGVNPFVAFGQGYSPAETALGAQSVSSGSAPSPTQSINPFSAIPNALAQVAGAYASLNSGENVGVDTDVKRAAFDDLVRQVHFEASNAEATAQLQQLNAQAAQLYAIPSAHAALQNAYALLNKTQSEISNLDADTIVKIVQKDLVSSQAKVSKQEALKLQAEIPLFLEQYKQTINLIKRQQKTEDSKQQLNYANANQANAAAEESRSRTSTENALRQYKVDFANMDNGVKALELKYLYKTIKQRVANQGITNGKLSAEWDKLVSEMDKIRKETKNITSGYLDETFQGLINIAEKLGITNLVVDTDY